LTKKSYLIFALLLVCAVYLFETYVLTPATEHYRESLSKDYKTLQRYEYAVKGAGTTEKEVQALIANIKNTEKRLITEKSDFLASAKMQGEISDLTSKAGLNVATIRPMSAVKISDLTRKAGVNAATVRPPAGEKMSDLPAKAPTTRTIAEEKSTYSIIQVYFEGNGNIKQMGEFLKSVESNPLLLKIDKLSLNITNMQTPSDLKFKIQISALRKI
jgi:hypothetical protein